MGIGLTIRDLRACTQRSRAAGLADIAATPRRRRAALVRGWRAACSHALTCSRSAGWRIASARSAHGARTYYNFNIRLEATNVCVASCLFCSFARLKPGDPGSYTMSLEEAWDKLRSRAHQPLTEVHVVNGLHPDLPFDYYLELLRGFKRIRPDIHLKCFTAVEIAFFADLYGMTDEQVLARAAGGRARFAARRRRRGVRGARATEDLPRQVRRRSLPRDPPARARPRHALEHHDALRPHRDDRGARRSHAADARAAGRDRRLQAFIPLAFHPDNNQMRKLPAPTAADTLRVHAVSRLMLDNIPHIKGVLDCDRRRGGAARAVVWRRRPRRDRAGREDLPHGRRANARGDDARPTSAASSAPPAASRSSATRCTTSSPGPRPRTRSAVA